MFSMEVKRGSECLCKGVSASYTVMQHTFPCLGVLREYVKDKSRAINDLDDIVLVATQKIVLKIIQRQISNMLDIKVISH